MLTTDRLLLRQFCLSDAEDVLVFRGDAHVQRYKGPVYEHLEHAQDGIEYDHAEYERMDLNHIYAGTIADDFESVHLLEAVGFHLDGIRRKFSWEDDGIFHDSAMYSLLVDEYVA